MLSEPVPSYALTYSTIFEPQESSKMEIHTDRKIFYKYDRLSQSRKPTIHEMNELDMI